MVKLAGVLVLGSLAAIHASPMGGDKAQFEFGAETGNDGGGSDSNYEYGKFEYGNDGSDSGPHETGRHGGHHGNPHHPRHGGHHGVFPFVPRFAGPHGILNFIPKFIGSHGIVPIFNTDPERAYGY